MDDVLATISFYALGLLYPVVSGPLAALLLVVTLKRDERWPRLLFWPGLIVVHVAGYLLMMHTLDNSLVGSGFLSCLITPIFAVATALGLRLWLQRFNKAMDNDPNQRRWLIAGTIALPLLQLVTTLLLVLLAPSR